MIARLVLRPSIRDALFDHARNGASDSNGDGAPDSNGDSTENTDSDGTDTPREVCGVLAGQRRDRSVDDAAGDSTEGVAIVTAHRPVPNVAGQPRARYELDPAATVRAIETLEDDGFDHLGFYHSHPRGPRGPSRTDRAQATWPGYVYLIVSLTSEPVIGAWRWTGEAFVQLPVAVEE